MIIDHIGIVVKSLEKSILHWENVFGYKQYTTIITNTRQKVKVVFLKKNNSIMIKLVSPLSENSPIFQFMKKGGGIHHLCFKCNDINEQLIDLKQKKLRILVPPQPGEAFMNQNIAFVYAKEGLNIELIDTEIKTGIIK
ncbi:VOC family protein [Spirochaeta isovalerica]|uniref:Methylmalonyl-CoA/ethylmalonyl-CoA epimerase n=1 Tax=Spirochaeta isovalerica TaxID=150 RepID=A0A841R965_9SPIO|nr:VOC family protein [Spirochaeta isovalerica]MBB6479258.1 methylmalonyl-CoA/ethylmalonyl-CoA epimerase [Spirochaeta isovalerica]